MIDARELLLRESFAALGENPAFRYVMDYLRSEAERAKGVAVTASAEDTDAVARNKFIAWQEREKVVIGIDDLIDEQNKLREQESEDERNIASARSNRTGW